MAKLNMDHGFIRYITKNQLDRDKYDKECREKQQKRPASNRPKRPPQAIYTPPFRSSTHLPSAPSSSSSEGLAKPEANKSTCNPVQHSKVNICFTDDHGEVHTFTVYKTDDPVEVATQFCGRMNYSDACIQPLSQRIQKECAVYFFPSSQQD